MQDITVFKNDRTGVSPVIGVILMVAVTVIIAAVIGSSVLGVSESVSETPPQASFEAEQNNDFTHQPNGGSQGDHGYVTFELIGGEEVDMSNVDMKVNGKNAYDIFRTDSTPTGSPDDCSSAPCHYTTTPDEKIQAGDTVRVAVKQSDSGTEIGDDTRSFSTTDDYSVINGDSDDEGNHVQLEKGDEVTLVWTSGDQSQILAEYEVE